MQLTATAGTSASFKFEYSLLEEGFQKLHSGDLKSSLGPWLFFLPEDAMMLLPKTRKNSVPKAVTHWRCLPTKRCILFLIHSLFKDFRQDLLWDDGLDDIYCWTVQIDIKIPICGDCWSSWHHCWKPGIDHALSWGLAKHIKNSSFCVILSSCNKHNWEPNSQLPESSIGSRSNCKSSMVLNLSGCYAIVPILVDA